MELNLVITTFFVQLFCIPFYLFGKLFFVVLPHIDLLLKSFRINEADVLLFVILNPNDKIREVALFFEKKPDAMTPGLITQYKKLISFEQFIRFWFLEEVS